ncbi:hypothetical protein K466DRAFT_524032 [Polyporus arcularius HHB13444]|uniref:Uncharacterized protein n=1 Tax=Polyporus arcularius HHB13444 TaxID=1314778 RepID=A0A5C3PC09_9APHY|nr:hypothetical protein K466DRAFT_524032 [Polyporus arcularius HHB13444]
MGGLPVVRVTDTPHDIREFLRVAYGSSPPTRAPLAPFSVLAAWLRVGIKYKMQVLADHAYVNLQSLFPATLSEWDERDGPESSHDFKDQNAIEALNLFQQTGQFGMLQVAIYRCCQLDPDVVRNGTTRADGTPERLSRKNVELIARAKERLKEYGARMIEESRERFKRSEYCSYWQFRSYYKFCSCQDVIEDLRDTKTHGREAWREGDPLDSRFLQYIDRSEDSRDYELRQDFACYMGACSNCMDEVRSEVGEMRARVWNELPAIVGVADVIDDWVCDN